MYYMCVLCLFCVCGVYMMFDMCMWCMLVCVGISVVSVHVCGVPLVAMYMVSVSCCVECVQ